jgi:hypothetical protein
MLRRSNGARRREGQGSTATTTCTATPRPSEPARVYPSPGRPDRWVVEAPAAANAAAREPVVFNGPNAQSLALRYAYEAFGSARFFPFAVEG